MDLIVSLVDKSQIYQACLNPFNQMESLSVGGHEKDTKSGISGSSSIGEPIIIAEVKLFE